MGGFWRRFTLAMMIACMGFALPLGQPAQAVQLDAGGLGQVLIYPYYTVHNQQQTLLSIVNTSDADQVLQVTFREALNGRAVQRIQAWLGRHDVWTATVFALADAGLASEGAALLTYDRTCTTPSVFASGLTLANGVPYLPFANDSYADGAGDGGPEDLGRTRHGWIEVIAMADVTGPLATAITIGTGGVPRGCNLIPSLATSANVATRPSGGLMGAVSVIRGGSGTLLSSRAEALSGFSETSLFNEPSQPAPDLGSVNEGTVGSAVSAKVVDDQGHLQVLTYGGLHSESRPIDAVSAVLMATHIKNEYQTSRALAAATDWILTFPTKPFYTDPAIVGMAGPVLPPFDEIFAAPGASRACAPYRIYDQNQKTLTSQTNSCSLTSSPIGFNPNRFLIFYQSANVIPFGDSYTLPSQSGVLLAPIPPGLSSYETMGQVRPLIGAAGWLNLDMAPTNFSHQLPPSAEGKILSGLPTIGYSASNIVNNNVINGVLANYAATVRHATSVTCAKASDSTPCD